MTNKHSRRRKRRSKTFKKVLLAPFYIVINTFAGLKDALLQLAAIFGIHPEIRRRRNSGFEKAGRESAKRIQADARAKLNLRKANRVRDKEIIDQVRYENRMLSRRNCKEAEQLRETMRTENKSVSQGSVVSHLAEMQRRHTEKPSQE